ncbi:uncharacterized protein At3g49140-like isoform X1 [Magnolia sinica]|uniref:uncharacterized protein At3g49140-like isoform X1 n=1 Tax=Magnolia sinica TaxID=86752 RepID=UPI002658C792|nr:uncharacterized protein At3g49140-like isoform X1 [Magnolia sinica]
MMIESALAVGFRTSGLSSSSAVAIASCRSSCNFEDPMIVGSRASHRFPSSRGISHDCGFWRDRLPKRNSFLLKSRVRASAATPEEHSEPLECSSREKSCYHPFEEVGEPVVPLQQDDAKLTDAEITRTIIEVNSKATLMFSGPINDEIHEKVFWPDLPYVTDERGDIYFVVHSDEDIMQTLTAENNFVQVIIGLDNIEMLTEMELSGPSNMDFDIEEIMDEDSNIDDDDDNDEDWVAILDDEEDDLDFEALGDWANLDTMRSSHPMYFAKKISEVVSNLHLDWMDQPSTGLAIQGLLRPAFIEEHAIVRKHIAGKQTNNDGANQAAKVVEDNTEGLGMPNGHEHESSSRTSSKDNAIWTEDLDKDESLQTGSSFYKLEMIKIQLVSAYGKQACSEHYKISFSIISLHANILSDIILSS